MPRISIQLPEAFLFRCVITVQQSHVNRAGHVGNDSFLTILQEARTQFYGSMGFEDELAIDGAVGQMITDAASVYKLEAFLGDKLQVEVTTGDFNKYGFDLYFRVTNVASAKLVLEAKTGIICYDYEKKKVARMPDKLLEKLTSPSG